MDEKLFECAVCLDICRECVNCTKCNQILCKAHVAHLRCCPVCRDSPFNFQENVALQRIIRDYKERMGITTPPSSTRAVDAVDTGSSAGYGQWLSNALFGESAPPEGPESVPPERPPRAAGNADAAIEGVVHRPDPRHGEKIPCGGRREGHFKKVPSDEHRVNMQRHVNSCTHEDCDKLWSGPWGSFIGGPRGRTHFELTECPVGKRMNQLIGWDYDDPPC